MDQNQYVAKVRDSLQALGFSADVNERLPLVMHKDETWGHLAVALAPLDRVDGAEREAIMSAAGAYIRSQRWLADGAKTVQCLVVFPFTRKVPPSMSEAIVRLRHDDPRGRWAVIPWTADLEVELVDQHTGLPKIDPRVARALTEVPRGAVEHTWRQVTGPQIGRQGLGRLRIDLGYVPATRLILAVTIAYYLLTVLMGAGVMGGLASVIGGPPLPVSLAFGANGGRQVLELGQQWRVLTMVLLHGGLIHLGLNMWALWNVGRHVEMIYGSWRMAFIYLIAGVAGGVASVVFRPTFGYSVGASGAILGLMGALVYFALAIPGRRVDWRAVLGPVIINIGFGFFMGGLIDNYAHVGGFAGGLLAAFLAGIPGQRRPWRIVAMSVAGVLVLGILVDLVRLPYLPL